jgi:hypothetical protein
MRVAGPSNSHYRSTGDAEMSVLLRRIVAFAFAALPVIAGAYSESIAFVPAAPTSADRIALTLTGQTTDCETVDTRNVRVAIDGSRITLTTELSVIYHITACSDLVRLPFEAQLAIGPLAAGRYTVHWVYTGYNADRFAFHDFALDVSAAPGGGIPPVVELPVLSMPMLIGLSMLLSVVAWRVRPRRRTAAARVQRPL